MFSIGQAEGVTPGGTAPGSATEIVDDLSTLNPSVPVGAGTSLPAANTVTSMSNKMLDVITTSPEDDVAAAVAAGELTPEEVEALVEEGVISEESFDAAVEAEEISEAAEGVKEESKNDTSSKIASLISDAKSKATKAVDSAVDKVKNFSVPTTLEEVKKSSLGEVIKVQDTAAQSYKKNNCAANPYIECAACKFSKTCLDPDAGLKALVGSFSFLDEYTKALKRGDANQASQMIDCPGRRRELMGKDGILGTVTGIAASVSTITATAVAGNAKLFSKVTSAVATGDLRVVARNEFQTMAGKVVENGSVVANMRTAMSNVGINPSTLTQAALPPALRTSGTANKSIKELLSSSVDAKKICGFNGMSTGSITEVTSAIGTIDKNYNTAIKQGNALGVLFNKAKAASDSHAKKIDSMLDTAYRNRMK